MLLSQQQSFVAPRGDSTDFYLSCDCSGGGLIDGENEDSDTIDSPQCTSAVLSYLCVDDCVSEGGSTGKRRRLRERTTMKLSAGSVDAADKTLGISLSNGIELPSSSFRIPVACKLDESSLLQPPQPIREVGLCSIECRPVASLHVDQGFSCYGDDSQSNTVHTDATSMAAAAAEPGGRLMSTSDVCDAAKLNPKFNSPPPPMENSYSPVSIVTVKNPEINNPTALVDCDSFSTVASGIASPTPVSSTLREAHSTTIEVSTVVDTAGDGGSDEIVVATKSTGNDNLTESGITERNNDNAVYDPNVNYLIKSWLLSVSNRVLATQLNALRSDNRRYRARLESLKLSQPKEAVECSSPPLPTTYRTTAVSTGIPVSDNLTSNLLGLQEDKQLEFSEINHQQQMLGSSGLSLPPFSSDFIVDQVGLDESDNHAEAAAKRAMPKKNLTQLKFAPLSSAPRYYEDNCGGVYHQASSVHPGTSSQYCNSDASSSSITAGISMPSLDSLSTISTPVSSLPTVPDDLSQWQPQSRTASECMTVDGQMPFLTSGLVPSISIDRQTSPNGSNANNWSAETYPEYYAGGNIYSDMLDPQDNWGGGMNMYTTTTTTSSPITDQLPSHGHHGYSRRAGPSVFRRSKNTLWRNSVPATSNQPPPLQDYMDLARVSCRSQQLPRYSELPIATQSCFSNSLQQKLVSMTVIGQPPAVSPVNSNGGVTDTRDALCDFGYNNSATRSFSKPPAKHLQADTWTTPTNDHVTNAGEDDVVLISASTIQPHQTTAQEMPASTVGVRDGRGEERATTSKPESLGMQTNESITTEESASFLNFSDFASSFTDFINDCSIDAGPSDRWMPPAKNHSTWMIFARSRTTAIMATNVLDSPFLHCQTFYQSTEDTWILTSPGKDDKPPSEGNERWRPDLFGELQQTEALGLILKNPMIATGRGDEVQCE